MSAFLGIFLILFAARCAQAGNARIVCHCDNRLYLNKREANGQWEELYYEGSWKEAVDITIPVTSTTKLQFDCYDVGYIGGFIATVHYGGKMYSTKDPLSDGQYTITEGETDPSNLRYLEKTGWPWYRQTAGIESTAQWVWNWKTFNTLIFEFTFEGLNATEGEQQCYFIEGNPVCSYCFRTSLQTGHTYTYICPYM